MDLFYAFLKQRSAAGNISSLELLNEAERYNKNEKQRMDLFYAFLKQRSAAGNISLELLNEAERYVSPLAL
ncbi:Eukaryotic translation initiation factor 5 [Operophtera brumata]|uniref:Eukaryotic translation initiation factor 5 n=1 Tax=Operophtera brumata TaxID=104452 RepID=A0A0L7LRE1_OPEBR|nr:Eukaryotic translation initiation factor 5 [Operophtera brumata]